MTWFSELLLVDSKTFSFFSNSQLTYLNLLQLMKMKLISKQI